MSTQDAVTYGSPRPRKASVGLAHALALSLIIIFTFSPMLVWSTCPRSTPLLFLVLLGPQIARSVNNILNIASKDPV